MSIIKTIIQEVVKVLTAKTAITIVSLIALGLSSLFAHYKINKTNTRIDILETEIRNSSNDKIKSFLRECPIFTGIAWMQYNATTNELLFRSVIVFDDIGIYDASSQNDLYKNQFVDAKTLSYFTKLDDGEVSFMDENDEKWQYDIFYGIKIGAWYATNKRIKERSNIEHIQKMQKLVGSDIISVKRLYNVVIKDKEHNIIYILSLAMSNSNIACFGSDKELTKAKLANLANIIKFNSNIA